MKLHLVLPGMTLAIAMAAFGCGGGSSSSGGGNGATKTAAVFEGSYVGPYTDTGSDTDTGEAAINVTSTGAITGRVIDVTGLGTVGITGQATFVSSTATTATGSFSVTSSNGNGSTGNLTLNISTGTLTGSLLNKSNGQTSNFTAGIVSTTGKNSFAGFYNGTTTINGAVGTPANTLAMIIDGTGKVTAFLTDNVVGQSGKGGIGQGTITSKTGAVTVSDDSGTLTLKNGVLSGSLTPDAADDPALVLTLNENE